MGKKIYINEKALGELGKRLLLPSFLYRQVKDHKTSLGNNEAFPNTGEYPFDYVILKERYKKIKDTVDEVYGLADASQDELVSVLSASVKECQEQERPIRDSLERICLNMVIGLFSIPKESINIECKIVDKVKCDKGLRMMPEADDEIKYSFEDVDDIEFANKEVAKRRFVDALIQGATKYYWERISSSSIEPTVISNELQQLYDKIYWLNEYVMFIGGEKMDDKHQTQGSYVTTHIGADDKKTSIMAQGLIFPLLMQETVRGLFELFSVHGLPQDKRRAMYIVRKADFALAEPWDMRLGPVLYERMFGNIGDDTMVPYAFTAISSFEPNEFNNATKEILANTKKGKRIKNKLARDIADNMDYQSFQDRMKMRRLDRSMIADGYFTAADMDSLVMDDDDDNVIAETDKP